MLLLLLMDTSSSAIEALCRFLLDDLYSSKISYDSGLKRKCRSVNGVLEYDSLKALAWKKDKKEEQKKKKQR